MKKAIGAIFTILLSIQLYAQTGLTTTVRVNAIPNSNGTITLVWPKATFTGKYNIYKNISGIPLNFTSIVASPLNSDTAWTDNAFTAGLRVEYAVVRVNSSNATMALGYIEVGNKTAEIPSHGSLILVVDSNYIAPLAAEIATLKNDLETNGFPVYTLYAGRKEKPLAVKNKIKALWENVKPTPSFVYLLGHVPVPYSGNYTGNSDRCAYPPDGHVEGSGNHTGAWPADVFYGDFEGIWTDNSVNTTTGSLTRNHNIPGDGKYDQCSPPSPLVVRIGRVDLTSMSAFSKTDTALTRDYLNRVHQWRINAIPFIKHGLIDDNFTSLDLSATGWNNITSCLPIDSVYAADYFTSQNSQNYLWSYGCGAGSYTNCSGVGSTTNFAQSSTFSNIFTALAGSFFGDWDVNNNFLRAPLCKGSLFSFWGGIPRWYAHYFGLGKTIGECANITQNSTSPSFNASQNKAHIALMGDPTLTLATVPPAGKLSANSSAGKVSLSWAAATGNFDGYVIYRIDTITNIWTRVNPAIITGTTYTDPTNWSTGFYKYAVRTIRLETTGSGSYYALGGGTFAWVSNTNSVWQAQNLTLSAFPNPSTGKVALRVAETNLSEARISIFDFTGKTVTVPREINVDNREYQLDFSHLQSGIYLIAVETADGLGITKVQIYK